MAALDAAVADDLADLQRASREIQRQASPVPGALQASEQGVAWHLSNRQALETVPAILANALCYLSAYSQDQQERWPDNAPAKLVRQVEHGSETEKNRALSKLWALEQSRVRWVGKEFERQSQVSDRSLQAHWRKGHWRNQAHGPHRQLRKLLWIRPTRVLGATLQDPRVWEVREPGV